MRVMRTSYLENPQVRWFLAASAPVAAGWAAAFGIAAPAEVARVATIGLVASAGAIGLGFLLWRLTMRSAVVTDGPGLRVGGLVVVIVVAAVGWVWLQYAFNPFRVRSIAQAMSISRSLPWQLVAGVSVFSGFVIAAQMVRLRERVRSLSGAAVAEPAPPLEHLSIRTGTRTVLVPLATVERLQGCDDHVAVFAGGKRMLASYRMRDVEQRLDASRFVRIHRSHIVNVAFIQRVERLDPNRDVVVMKSGERVAASRAGSVVLRRLLRG